MILLAKENATYKDNQILIGNLDITIQRNYFGRQASSFEANLSVPVLGNHNFSAIFIRAPAVTKVDDSVEVLAEIDYQSKNSKTHKYDKSESNVIVAVRKGYIMATAFHPELTDDDRFHKLFIDSILK